MSAGDSPVITRWWARIPNTASSSFRHSRRFATASNPAFRPRVSTDSRKIRRSRYTTSPVVKCASSQPVKLGARNPLSVAIQQIDLSFCQRRDRGRQGRRVCQGGRERRGHRGHRSRCNRLCCHFRSCCDRLCCRCCCCAMFLLCLLLCFLHVALVKEDNCKLFPLLPVYH